jgi:hypothetical protein
MLGSVSRLKKKLFVFVFLKIAIENQLAAKDKICNQCMRKIWSFPTKCSSIWNIYYRHLILHMRSELGTASPAGLHAIKKRMNSLPLVTFNPFFSFTLGKYPLYCNESTLFVMSSIYTLANYIMILQHQIYCSRSYVTLGMEEDSMQGHIKPLRILCLLSYRVLWFEASLARINFFSGSMHVFTP